MIVEFTKQWATQTAQGWVFLTEHSLASACESYLLCLGAEFDGVDKRWLRRKVHAVCETTVAPFGLHELLCSLRAAVVSSAILDNITVAQLEQELVSHQLTPPSVHASSSSSQVSGSPVALVEFAVGAGVGAAESESQALVLCESQSQAPVAPVAQPESQELQALQKLVDQLRGEKRALNKQVTYWKTKFQNTQAALTQASDELHSEITPYNKKKRKQHHVLVHQRNSLAGGYKIACIRNVGA